MLPLPVIAHTTTAYLILKATGVVLDKCTTEPHRMSLPLNEFMCGWLNRTGLLCGKCQPGLGPVVLSNTPKCMRCLDNGLGWLLYVFLATFPSTIFFLVILFCKIRITSGPFNANMSGSYGRVKCNSINNFSRH